jgi:hypothetical protein
MVVSSVSWLIGRREEQVGNGQVSQRSEPGLHHQSVEMLETMAG